MRGLGQGFANKTVRYKCYTQVNCTQSLHATFDAAQDRKGIQY